MVAGNLIRKMRKLKLELESTTDQHQIDKLNRKIDQMHKEIKVLKMLDNYEISKKAILAPDVKKWKKMICDTKIEDHLTAMVILKNAVQRHISKFVSEHENYMEWFNEYLELRDKKKEWKDEKPIRKS